MRAKFFIGLVILSIIGSGYAAISAGAAQEIQGYWKPPAAIKFVPTDGRGVPQDIRDAPMHQQNPDDIAYNNAFDFIKDQKFSKAISEFDRLINRNRKYADAYYGRGLVYALEGKYDSAIADFTRYLELEKKDVNSYCNRGLARVLQGQYDQGLVT